MSDCLFDMPRYGTWKERSGWVVRGLMAEFGLTLDQAAGLVGNLGYESDGFTKLQEIHPAVPGSRGGWGWAQWTGPRRREFEAITNSRGLDVASDRANWLFLVDELRGSHRATIDVLRNAPTLEQAVWSVGQTYERPSGTTPEHLPGYEGRLEWARLARMGAQDMEEAQEVATPIPETGQITPAVSIAVSAAVSVLQAMLNVAGARPPLVIDGEIGPRTRAAIDWYFAEEI